MTLALNQIVAPAGSRRRKKRNKRSRKRKTRRRGQREIRTRGSISSACGRPPQTG
jgi:hypothetical protein